MVYLNRIYTRTGDDGLTSLGDGSRVPKTNPRIAAFGGVDELNAVLGVALTCDLEDSAREALEHVQNDLFDLGADLCVPEATASNDGGDAASDEAPARLRIATSQVERLENWIDEFNARLEPLSSFVLPGGSSAAAHLHHARTVCRRVEIAVLELAVVQPVNRQASVYLNRLSDLLFVMSRTANDGGRNDVLWQPGAGQSDVRQQADEKES